ncbi:peptidase M23 [Streptomyces sp. NPDC055078]
MVIVKKTALVVLALGLTVLCLCVLLVSAASGQSQTVQTCEGLQAVGNGRVGDAAGGEPVLFEGIERPTGTQVVVPLRPEGSQTAARWSARQVRNASTITNVARSRKLSPRSAVIAVATAMQESTLENLRSGDRDSVGLFQQRPSQGWGTVEQLTDPIYAAGKFYDSLVAIPEWQTRPLARVAGAVQRPAGELVREYAKWEQAAGALVAKTWGTHAVTSISTGCDSDEAEGAGSDPAAEFTVRNPRTPAQAIAAARRTSGKRGWYRMCDNFVAQAYGYGFSGSETANVHWNRLVDGGLAHPGDANPPAGSLLFYDTGEDAGHVALYLGNGKVASNDVLDSYRGEGKIVIVSRKDLTAGKWRLRYRGWTQPGFPSAGGTSTI